jgi:DNA-3-methyladenine glycosylase II
VPAWPFRLPARGGGDRVMTVAGGVVTRLLDVDGRPVLARAWQPELRRVVFRAEAIDPGLVSSPRLRGGPGAAPAAGTDLALAIERMRFALGVDLDLTAFYRRFREDPLIGPVVRRRPWLRPRRRPWPWEALAWAVTEQLIEASRAAVIQRRIVRLWGPRIGDGRDALRNVPCPAVIVGRAPAELESLDLAARRAIALRAVAREITRERCDPGDPASDDALRRIPNIGPWTVQCLGFNGRGELDSLPAGDLAYVKLVGHLARLGRRATVEEVEEFYEPYEPYRGLAGQFMAAGWLRHVAAAGPQRLAA